MSDFSQTTDFSAKDALTSGDPNKIIYGADLDTEFAALETASGTKTNKISSPTTNALIIQSAGGDVADSGVLLGTAGTPEASRVAVVDSSKDLTINALTLGGALAVTGESTLTGNVGIGVALETWQAAQRVLQIGGTGSLWASLAAVAGAEMITAQNLYRDASGTYRHLVTDEASDYMQSAGRHQWYTAVSAAAAAAATLVLQLKLNLNGTLLGTQGFSSIPPTTAGSATVYTATLGISAYDTSRVYEVQVDEVNTGSLTMNFDTVGAKDVKLLNGNDPVAGQFAAGMIAKLLYDGTNLVLLNPADAEGTWTPTLQDASRSDGESQTYSQQYGSYTRVGNRVFFSGHLAVSSLGTLTTSEAAVIAGLPFTSNATGIKSGSMYVGQSTNLAITAGTYVSGQVVSDDTIISLANWDVTTGRSQMLISEVTASGQFYFAGQYII